MDKTPVGSNNYRKLHYIKTSPDLTHIKNRKKDNETVAILAIFFCSAVISIAVFAYVWSAL